MANEHIDDQSIEAYALNRLAEAGAAPVEEHLLVCEECRERLAKFDACVRAMRAATRGFGPPDCGEQNQASRNRW
jgi:anti-sigma factor RsiW